MQHWNGHQLCVIDTETTGLDPWFHEIAQIAVLPLDNCLKIRRDVVPFNIFMKLEFPERVEKSALRKNNLTVNKLQLEGFDREKTKDLLFSWRDKLGLSCTVYGTPKKMMLLGHNLAYDIAFIQNWLGEDMYAELFDYHYRDTMILANYLNDRAAVHAEKVPFSKVTLTWLANQFNIDTEGAHDALIDCIITSKVYGKLCEQGLLG